MRLSILFLALTATQVFAVGNLAAPARRSLERATDYLTSISTNGGYLWNFYPDLSHRAGEVVATQTQVWVQPPGTPSVGLAFLAAYQATGDAKHLEAARRVGEALVEGQLESGGWDYLIDFDPIAARKWFRRSDVGKISAEETAKRKNNSTFDDNNTQSAVRFLLAYCDIVKDSKEPRDTAMREARDYALSKILEAQYPIGAWPQRWDGKPHDPTKYPVLAAHYPKEYPREYPKLNYYGYYTFNDGTQRDLVLLMLDAWKRTGRTEYLEAAKKGGEFVLLAQMPEPQPVWAQQYNPQMEPAWARAFEPPSVASAESLGALRILMELNIEIGDPKFLEPIPKALAWFERSQIAPNRWARYYELETNKPIYGDRDGKIYYHLQDISEERRNGYSWEGEFNFGPLNIAWENLQKEGRESILASRLVQSPSSKQKALTALAPRVESILASQDEQGRWITRAKKINGDLIDMQTFIGNMQALSAYLEALR